MSLSPPPRLARDFLLHNDTHQLVGTPLSDHPPSLHRVEYPPPIDQVVPETALQPFSVAQLQHSPTPLIILMEITLVVHPALFRMVEITIIVGSIQLDWFLIVEYPLALEGVMTPIPLVGYPPIGIVERPLAMHLVILPIPAILPSLPIVESPIATPQTAHLATLVVPLRERLLHEDGIGQFLLNSPLGCDHLGLIGGDVDRMGLFLLADLTGIGRFPDQGQQFRRSEDAFLLFVLVGIQGRDTGLEQHRFLLAQ